MISLCLVKLILILFKISGYSKTFSADALSAAYALDHALYLMQNEYLPGAFIGAAESPLTPLVYNACVHSEEISLSGTFLPLSKHADGCLLGEGAGIITLERYDNAQLRGQKAFASIIGLGIDATLSGSIAHCLEQAGRGIDDIDCVLMDLKGSLFHDGRQINELDTFFGDSKKPWLTTCKPLYGNMLGADFAVDIVIAVQALIAQKIPCGLSSDDELLRPKCGKLVQDQSINAPLKTILVYACNAEGASISVLIENIDS